MTPDIAQSSRPSDKAMLSVRSVGMPLGFCSRPAEFLTVVPGFNRPNRLQQYSRQLAKDPHHPVQHPDLRNNGLQHGVHILHNQSEATQRQRAAGSSWDDYQLQRQAPSYDTGDYQNHLQDHPRTRPHAPRIAASGPQYQFDEPEQLRQLNHPQIDSQGVSHAQVQHASSPYDDPQLRNQHGPRLGPQNIISRYKDGFGLIEPQNVVSRHIHGLGLVADNYQELEPQRQQVHEHRAWSNFPVEPRWEAPSGPDYTFRASSERQQTVYGPNQSATNRQSSDELALPWTNAKLLTQNGTSITNNRAYNPFSKNVPPSASAPGRGRHTHESGRGRVVMMNRQERTTGKRESGLDTGFPSQIRPMLVMTSEIQPQLPRPARKPVGRKNQTNPSGVTGQKNLYRYNLIDSDSDDAEAAGRARPKSTPETIVIHDDDSEPETTVIPGKGAQALPISSHGRNTPKMSSNPEGTATQFTSRGSQKLFYQERDQNKSLDSVGSSTTKRTIQDGNDIRSLPTSMVAKKLKTTLAAAAEKVGGSANQKPSKKNTQDRRHRLPSHAVDRAEQAILQNRALASLDNDDHTTLAEHPPQNPCTGVKRRRGMSDENESPIKRMRPTTTAPRLGEKIKDIARTQQPLESSQPHGAQHLNEEQDVETVQGPTGAEAEIEGESLLLRQDNFIPIWTDEDFEGEEVPLMVTRRYRGITLSPEPYHMFLAKKNWLANWPEGEQSELLD